MAPVIIRPFAVMSYSPKNLVRPPEPFTHRKVPARVNPQPSQYSQHRLSHPRPINPSTNHSAPPSPHLHLKTPSSSIHPSIHNPQNTPSPKSPPPQIRISPSQHTNPTALSPAHPLPLRITSPPTIPYAHLPPPSPTPLPLSGVEDKRTGDRKPVART